MPGEYSYFRAAGASLAAVEMVNEARAEVSALRNKLVASMGADDMMGGVGYGEDKFRMIAFVFHDEAKIPEGWKVDRQMSNDGTRLVAAFCLPPAGSAEHFNMVAMAGLMERASKMSFLENVLGAEKMPDRNLPAGSYSGSFVRYRTYEAGRPISQAPGRLRDKWTVMSYSNSPVTRGDPLDHIKMVDDWYIRVPNKEYTAEPAYIPPDSKQMTYAEMSLLDQREDTKRNKRQSFPTIH